MIISIISFLQNLDPWLVIGLLFITSMMLIILFARFFGKDGLYIYSVIAIIIANIQVLKAVHLTPFTSPIPLGNVLFTSLFLVSDIITECYGKKSAQKGIWLGFAASLMFSLIMLITIGMKPVPGDSADDAMFLASHNAMALLFTPSASIVAASLIAYFVSLWFDVIIFHSIKLITKDRWLWLRSFVSSSLGIVLDNIVFSVLAWIIFAVVPVPIGVVANSYIVGSISIRLFLTVFSIPVFYLVRKIVNNFENNE